MNCTEFLAKLTDYFDGQVEPELLAEVKEHIGVCQHCEVVVSTTRQTISIYRHHEIYAFPEELANRLRAAVMQRCSAVKRENTPSGACESAETTEVGERRNLVS